MTEHTKELLALVSNVELNSIEFFEISASRQIDISALEDGSVTVSPDYTLGTHVGDGGDRFLIRLKVEFVPEVGRFAAEVAAEYKVTSAEPIELTQDLLIEFSNQVAIMALLPYLRQAIADVTQRVFGLPLTMPITQRGELAFLNEPVDHDS